MALKKTDLYSSLWRSCDELRGGMDASQYKDYILTLLFVKYVSDKAKADPHSMIEVPAGCSFEDMLAADGAKDIGDRCNVIIGGLAEANDLAGVIDLADFNDPTKLGDGKSMQDRLSKLVRIFGDLDFSGSRAEGDDLLGDAYEYLMRHFATESGKSKGQFYTPAEVSRVLAKVVGIDASTSQDQTAYDPTCGSGSLLLKVADEAPRGLTIYGQEKDNATWALSKMNMILHGRPEADVRRGDTIVDPRFTTGGSLRTFDFVVANPPFSTKSWSSGLEHEYGRFEYGRPPEKNGDYAFLLHVLTSLRSTGKAAVILPHGVLFRGNAEALIRRRLLEQGFVKGIIGLPPNLFYGTGIPACVLVLDKEHAQARTGVFMVDAARGFTKEGPKNRLRSRDVHRIVDVFTRQAEVDGYSRMVPLAEIRDPRNDCNLNLPRYIDSSEPEDLQDLDAHLNGGIPERDVDALSRYWTALPRLRGELFAPNRDGYVDLAVDPAHVQPAVVGSDELRDVARRAREVASRWFDDHRAALEAIGPHTDPNVLVTQLGDDLLARFASQELLDEYGVYERLMTYWHATMHDDLHLVMHDGWVEAARPRPARVVGKDKRGTPTYEGADIRRGSGTSTERYVMDLVPPELVVARSCAGEWEEVARLDAEVEGATRALEEFVEEHATEAGLLAAAIDDKDKVSATLAKRRRAVVGDDGSDPEEFDALGRVIGLFDAQAEAKRAAKEARARVEALALAAYADLGEVDVKQLVIDDKWRAAILDGVQLEVEQALLPPGRPRQAARRAVLRDGRRPGRPGRGAERQGRRPPRGDGGGVVGLARWHVDRLGELAAVRSGGTPPTSVRRYYGGTVPWVSIADMTSSGKYVRETATTLTEAGLEASAAVLYEPDVVLYAMYASLGEVCIPVGRVASSQAILGIRPGPRLQRDYLYYFLESVKSEVRHLGQHGTQAKLNAGMVRDFEVPLPSVEEQARIAEVLGGADELIAALERQVAKRESVKHGAMQQLLTGRTRLGGVEGEWRSVRLGQAGTFSGNGVDKRTVPGEEPVRLLNYVDVHRSEFIGPDTPTHVVTAPASKVKQCDIRAGDVFFTPTSETPDDIARSSVASCDVPGAVYSYHLVRWRPAAGWDPRYLGYAFANAGFRDQVSTLAAGSGTRYVLSLPGFRSLRVLQPPREEQRAIGAVLGDMGDEVAALRARLAKARALRRGMVQELLTGRTRLPVRDEVPA